MDGFKFDAADVDQLIGLLADVDGIDGRTPDDTPTQVGYIGDPIETPGVVVQVFGYTFNALDSYLMRGRLLLVVPDAPARAAIAALGDLFNRVTTIMRPSGEVTHEAVSLPDRGAPLPALSVPFAVRCTPASQE